MSTIFMFRAESTEKIYSKQVKPMVYFAHLTDMDNNKAVFANMNTCLIVNTEDNKVVPITPKGTLDDQAKTLSSLKDTKVLLTLNWRGLYVLDREPDNTKESHRLEAVIVSINQFTMKVKETSGFCCYTIILNGIDFIEPISAAAADDAVSL